MTQTTAPTATLDGDAGDRGPFKSTYGNYIGGKWIPAADGRTFDNTSPVHGKVLWVMVCLLRDGWVGRAPS
ncbi:MAG: hypothetical protein AAFV77_05560 [Planctomycetota bacterium]